MGACADSRWCKTCPTLATSLYISVESSCSLNEACRSKRVRLSLEALTQRLHTAAARQIVVRHWVDRLCFNISVLLQVTLQCAAAPGVDPFPCFTRVRAFSSCTLGLFSFSSDGWLFYVLALRSLLCINEVSMCVSSNG